VATTRWGAPWTIGRGATSELDPPSAMMRRVAVAAAVTVLMLVAATVFLTLSGRPVAVVAAAVVSLTVAVGGVGWTIVDRAADSAAPTVGLPAAGLAGAALTGLLPSAPGYLVMILVVVGLGMSRPLVSAIVTGLILLAATYVAFLLVGGQPMASVISVGIGAAFCFSVGVFLRSAAISRDAAHAAQARAEQLLEQLQASQAAQAEAAALAERARLAREVHDILAHSLSGLVLALDTAELLGKRPDADTGGMLEQIGRAQRIARDGLADTRRAISALRGDELPGPALLERLVRRTSEATGVDVSLAVHGEQRQLPPEIGLALYRTAQEALINTAKYAGRGGTAELRLTYRPDDVTLEVEDARPVDAVPGPAGLTFGGYGLTGMRERAELLGGRLTAGPTEDGFRVELWLPAGSP
jgi:signal transduction histidine kinase